MAAAEAIRDHYKGKSREILPQILAALGETLDQPHNGSLVHQSLVNRTEVALWHAVFNAGPGWMKVIRESTRHSDPHVRAAAFRAWLKPTNREANMAERRDELLVAIRRGLKDDSPLVRGQAAYALKAFWDAPPRMAEEAVSLLAAALDDQAKPRDGVESPAFEAAGPLTWFRVKAKPVFHAIVKAIEKARDTSLAFRLCMVLAVVAKSDPTTAEDAIKVFRSVFTNKQRPVAVREGAIRRLLGIGPAARSAIPDLIDLLDDHKTSRDLQSAALTVLADQGPRSAAAVPTLAKMLERSSVQWERLQAVADLIRLVLRIFRVEGRVVAVPVSRFAPRGRVILGPQLLLREVAWRSEAEQGGILDTLKAIGPAAAPAIEPLKRYWDKVRGDRLMEKRVYDALVEIER
jgi:HEAT repeat protein